MPKELALYPYTPSSLPLTPCTPMPPVLAPYTPVSVLPKATPYTPVWPSPWTPTPPTRLVPSTPSSETSCERPIAPATGHPRQPSTAFTVLTPKTPWFGDSPCTPAAFCPLV